MFWAIYVTLIAVGVWGIYESIVKRSQAFFPALVAFGAWSLVALVPDTTTGHDAVYNNSTGAVETVQHTVELGAEQYLFAALALLSAVWLAGVVIGIFPEDDQL